MTWQKIDDTNGIVLGKYVLVVIESQMPGPLPNPVVVGEWRGETAPYLVTPGITGTRLAWCDCLPPLGTMWPGAVRV